MKRRSVILLLLAGVVLTTVLLWLARSWREHDRRQDAVRRQSTLLLIGCLRHRNDELGQYIEVAKGSRPPDAVQVHTDACHHVVTLMTLVDGPRAQLWSELGLVFQDGGRLRLANLRMGPSGVQDLERIRGSVEKVKTILGDLDATTERSDRFLEAKEPAVREAVATILNPFHPKETP